MPNFDLNIEDILEDWEPQDALREIIANALDEQLLSRSGDIRIEKIADGEWIVRDFGRGLEHLHLTQNENPEKTRNDGVIGKFGIGLKDALATLSRNRIEVRAKSRHCDISLTRAPKQGFGDIVTLHAVVEVPSDPAMEGTEFHFRGLSDRRVEQAKQYFLKFSGETVIDRTRYGEIVQKRGETANIYINGVRAAQEDRFLFSYNILSIDAQIRKALNRERSNVGRSAYSDRVRKMLLDSRSADVAKALVKDFSSFNVGTVHDELRWIDVQEHAVKILNHEEKVLFVTAGELMGNGDMIDEAKGSGYEVFVVPENLAGRIKGKKDIGGNPIVDIGTFVERYKESFQYDFVAAENLTSEERAIYNRKDEILSLMGKRPKVIKQILISNSMRKEQGNPSQTVGCWEAERRSIVIKRSQLKSLSDFAGTLLHEAIHAASGLSDVNRAFEEELTEMIGLTASAALRKVGEHPSTESKRSFFRRRRRY